ncbi:hypothetical protein [Rhizobium sp. CNPSo 4039]|uniref:hypothetical protein n=1 Tax=Rhizobium sp. CNPSo 4039 TaxID=3021409 RepID=UPI00254A5887|nr:hypothetical protein [Rhizobium sp. CNPSo 4039]MDK4711582.1 hypothetical protein [Rhizobium sp. CNPSo 4039]
MGKAVKKEPILSVLDQYRNQFQTVIAAANAFENHDSQGQKLLYVALEQVFAFGEEIRHDMPTFEKFLDDHDKTLNKVTKENPYNALVDLTFSKGSSKSWRSEISNVLRLASATKVTEPLHKWLKDGDGISGRYKEAKDYFARTATQKNQKLRSSRLDMITAELTQSRIVTSPLPGVTLADGFHRSLLFSEGGQTFLVHVRDEDNQKTIDKYLLEVAGNRQPDDHPLAARPLYPLFRAVDLIVGTCKPSNTGKLQLIAIWNEATDNVPVTKLRFLSDANRFTNATVTLAHALPELEGKGQLVLELSDAETFRQLFQHDCQWHMSIDDQAISIVDDAKSQARLTLRPIANYLDVKLRQGAKLGLRTRHFQATCTGMKASASNLEMAAALFDKANRAQPAANPTPKRLQWLSEGATPEVGFANAHIYSGLSYPFLEFTAPTMAIDPQMELSLADIAALWKTASAYGEDLAGYIADSDVADAAFCIDHTFHDGDRFEYISPMVLGVSMARTQVCENFTAEPIPPPTSPTPSSGSKGTSPSNAPASSKGKSHNYPGTLANRRKNTAFPAQPYSSGKIFGAFISSFLPDYPHHRTERKFDFAWQLEWWRRMTDIPVHVVASNWTDREVTEMEELQRVKEQGGRIIREPAQGITLNRNRCLTEFYASDFDWGIVMDDDAAISHGPLYNSGAALFSEIAANSPADYDDIDIFYPIFPGKANSQGPLWKPEPELFERNHVFDPEHDLKGSLFVVRNFRKFGNPTVLLPADFDFHGEDTLFAIEALKQGYSVRRCGNIVLQEFGIGASHFPDRVAGMKIGNTRMAEMYADQGLRMSTRKGSEHLLDRSEMLKRTGRAGDVRIAIAKPR